MTVPAFPSNQIHEMRAAYASRRKNLGDSMHEAWDRSNKHYLQTGRDGGGCGCFDHPYSYIAASYGGEQYYGLEADPQIRYEWPLIRNDGMVGWVVRTNGDDRALAQVPLWNGIVPFPRRLFTLDADTRPVALAADGHTVLLTDGQQLQAFDTAPGLGLRLSRIFNPRAGLKQLAFLSKPFEGLLPLSDGSVLAYPSRYTEHPCTLIPPGGEGAPVHVPLRLLSEKEFKDRIVSQLPFAAVADINRLLQNAPPFIDDDGNVAALEMGINGKSDSRVFVVPDYENNTTDVYTFDQITLKKCATYAGTGPRKRDYSLTSQVRLSPGEKLIYVAEGPTKGSPTAPMQTRVIDVDTGRTAVLPGSHLTRSSIVGAADDSAVAAQGDDNAVWVYDRAQSSVIRLADLALSGKAQAADVMLRWTRDNQHVVAAFPHADGEGYVLQVFGRDGFRVSIPRIDDYQISGDAIIFLAEGKEHTLPPDLTAVDKEAWFTQCLEKLAMGEWLVSSARGTGLTGADGSPATVERADDHITIGTLRLPVRSATDTEPASAAS